MEELEQKFTGEEGLGRYFDLHESFTAYLNLKGVERWTYLVYLDRFDRFKVFDKNLKANGYYYSYLLGMEDYLKSWIRRAQPIFNFEEFYQQGLEEFNKLWEEGKVPLWEKPEEAPDSTLYCLACDKHFTKQTVFDGHLAGKKHLKGVSALKSKGLKDTKAIREKNAKESAEVEYQKQKPTAILEFLITHYMTILKSIRDDTRGYVERKQALTEKERVRNKIDTDGRNRGRTSGYRRRGRRRGRGKGTPVTLI